MAGSFSSKLLSKCHNVEPHLKWSTWASGGWTVSGCSLKNLLIKSCSARHKGSSSLRTCSNICKKKKNKNLSESDVNMFGQRHLLAPPIEFWDRRYVTLSNLVLSATSRSEADMLPMSSSEDDCERRLLEPCTVSLFRLEVEPVSFPELPWRPAVTRHT